MLFSDVIAAKSVKKQLLDMLSGGRLPHALLLFGSFGTGPLPLALAYIQRAMCTTPAENGDACSLCNACNKTSKFIHPDVHFSFPVAGTNKTSDLHYADWRKFLAESPYSDLNTWMERVGVENQQGNINRAECQRIHQALSLKSYEGGRKVLIMWLPELLGKEGNRLLKLLEEPPADTLFVLVAEQTEAILPTILSRCQLVGAPPLSDEALAEALVRVHKLGGEEALAMAGLSEGNYAEALSLLHEDQDDRGAIFIEWLRLCYAGNGVHLVDRVDQLAQLGRERLKFLMRYALYFLRELLFITATRQTSVRLKASEAEAAQRLAALVSVSSIDRISRLIDNCHAHIERNANPRALLLSTSVRMHQILHTP